MINIEDDILRLWRLGLLEGLLFDRTTRRNILWATEAHADLGDGYAARNEIRAELIIGDRSGVIKTRAKRAASVQSDRTRTHGEVFTPLRICRQMNDFADEVLSSRVSRADASGRRGALRYIDARVLEIACGEAPYLAGRYDVATGDEIPLDERVGIIDRKLRAADKLAADEAEWLSLAFRAFEASYGYELAGDNLLIARVNMLRTFEDYLSRRLRRAPTAAEYQRLIKIITWNVWQMDGLSGATPDLLRLSRAPDEDARQGNLFADIDSFTENDRGASRCRVYDWRSRRSVEFLSLGYRGGNRMKFDFIIGNPPYQEDLESTTNQARPIYHLFVEAAKQLCDKGLCLIIPSRWFAGGMGLDDFRANMMNDKQIRRIVDYINAKECFPTSSISGGVCYFLWERGTTGDCEFTSVKNGVAETMSRDLSEFPVLIRYNSAVSMVHKVMKSAGEETLATIVSSISPFGISTKERGEPTKENADDLLLHSSKETGYIPISKVPKGHEYLGKYHVLLSQTSAEHAGEPDKNGMYKVFTSSMKVMKPQEVCTHSYLMIGNYDTYDEALNLLKYTKTKFVRLLVLLAISSIHISKASFSFVPLQDFTPSSDIDWSKSVAEIDHQLYAKYGLSDEEINFIESHVKEME